MPDKEFQHVERDEKDDIREMLEIFISDRPGGRRMKLQSELTWEPPVDVVETEKEVIVIVDIAGMNGDDINVVTDGRLLKISGVRKNRCPPGRKQFHKVEIQVGRFEREIELPAPVDHSKVSARYKRGMLEIRILKMDPSERIRKVEID